MKKIKILSTKAYCFTVGKKYEVIKEKDQSDDGYKAEVIFVIDDEGDEFAICNQQEATYEFVN